MKLTIIITALYLFCIPAMGQISNPSFENDSTADLSGWNWRCYAVSNSFTPQNGGNWSIEVAGGSFQGCYPSYAYQKVTSVSDGQTYRLTGWAFGSSSRLYIGKISNGEISLDHGSNVPNDSWTYLSVQSSITLNDGDTALAILSVSTAGGPMVLNGYFDLISFEQVQGIDFMEKKSNLILSPNPFVHSTILKSDKVLRNGKLLLINQHGQTVLEMENLAGESITIYRNELLSGLYTILLYEDNVLIGDIKVIIVD